jgi:hypothetical protein
MSGKAPSIAASRLVNPPQEEVKISLEQLWKALELKVRQPQDFVAQFAKCDVVSDDGHKVVRKAHTKTGMVVDETCYLYEPTMVYFDGDIRVTNVVSYNEAGELILTYTFVNGIPGPASTGEMNTQERQEKGVQIGEGAVEHTLKQVRKMIKEGKL